MFQPEMSALNDVVPENMEDMSVTELVSHAEMSALNAVAPANMLAMLVTELTSQEFMLHDTPVSSIDETGINSGFQVISGRE